MDTYAEYEKINKHIDLSKEMHFLNMKGKCIVSKLENTKQIRKKKSGNFVIYQDVDNIYNIIVDLTNIKRFNTFRLFFCVQYYLDELLFKEINTLESFEIEDDTFKLSDMYFNQSTLFPLNEYDIEIIPFDEKEKNFNVEEAIFLRDFFKEHQSFIKKVNLHIDSIQDIDTIKLNLKKVFNRINQKIIIAIDFLDQIINKKVNLIK
jgi:hypothetical protein